MKLIVLGPRWGAGERDMDFVGESGGPAVGEWSRSREPPMRAVQYTAKGPYRQTDPGCLW